MSIVFYLKKKKRAYMHSLMHVLMYYLLTTMQLLPKERKINCQESFHHDNMWCVFFR